jgi:putative heme-binding domain-containing protein
MVAHRCNRILVAFWLMWVAGWAMPAPAESPAATPEQFGISRRTPWTTSRIIGSPEPPPPYETRRVFPKITFHNPLDIAFAPGTNRIFVAEQFGKIFSFPNDPKSDHADLFADISAQVHGWEKMPNYGPPNAVYGIAFHPKFSENHFVYICYTLQYNAPPGQHVTPKDEDGTHVSRFSVKGNPPVIDPDSEQVLVKWFAGGHNGGCLKFGPDGYLYISSGDGGDPDPPDPFNTGQDISDLLSSILRIDVDHPSKDKPYSIPPDNPFIKTPGARPEVFAYGLRNPWRMSFDRQTGNLWVGDVGWELWESVDCVKSGGNYGWSIMEGPNPVHPDGKRGPTPITPPALALDHSEAASLTGGVVYHGKKFPELAGQYIFGDWQTNLLWAAKCDGDKLSPRRTIAHTDQRIVAFGQQDDGELLIVDHQGGGLWEIVPNNQPNDPKKFPRKLSETGLFTSANDRTPAPGVIPFSINAQQWVDGASAQRWVALPGDSSMTWGKGVWGDDKPAWPRDSVLVRTLSAPTGTAPGSPWKHIETQILHFDGKQWQAYSYAWSDDQADATLVPAGGGEQQVAVADGSLPGGLRRQKWHFASRAQCLTCHNVWSDYALAFNAPQLDREEKFESITDNQVHTFRHIGLLLEPKPTTAPSSDERLTLTNPYDSSADLYERARSYLQVNCSHCHRFGGGGSALFDVRKELPPAKMNLIDVRPNLGGFNLDDPRLVCPGDPSRSVLLYRTAKLGRGRMPHIGSDVVDILGVGLLREWIASVQPAQKGQQPGKLLAEASAKRVAMLHALQSGTDAAATSQLDQLLSTPSGALALVGAIDSNQIAPGASLAAKSKGMISSQEFVRDLFRRFDPSEYLRDRLGTNIDAAKLLAMHGDAEKGREVFGMASAGLCSRCHRIGKVGTEFGPDLSHIASKYNRADLLDNILHPSKTITPGFATYIVRTKSGDTLSGFLLKKTDQELVLKDAQLKEVRIPLADVEKSVASAVSAMPEGILADLDAQQAADLLEWLCRLK